MSESQVLDIIETEVHKANKKGQHFTVNRQATRREGNWLYVLVTPEPADMRVSAYNSALVKVEVAVEKKTGVHLLLVPALPD